MAVIMAIAASAFTTINYQKAEGDEYGLKSSTYTKLTSSYNSSLCTTGTNQCGYRVTSSGSSHVTGSFNTTEASTYLSNGWIEPIGSTQGVYSGD